VPPQQIRTADELLGALLAMLPIPLTGLPSICVQRPWWLVVLAHEVGHHVAYDLLDEPREERIRSIVLGAADAGSSGSNSRLVRPSWVHELFADVFGVVCVGEAHVWAINELELASEETMARDADPYPPALARKEFNRQALEVLTGEDSGEESQGVSPQLGQTLRTVARALLETPLDGDRRQTLSMLCGWGSDLFAPAGPVSSWKDELLGPGDVVPEPTLTAARLAAAGSVAAWQLVAGDHDSESRHARHERLRQRTLELVANCREEGRRDATKLAPALDAHAEAADKLARMLIETRVEDDLCASM
jgi:hypothetical protein